ncbi:MAG: hypothetical protein HOQ05_03785 [Corynebacteriales bacterium]|nr:hypothetical protein [Mycobacteriales bacterium]
MKKGTIAIAVAGVLILGCLGVLAVTKDADFRLPFLSDSCRAFGDDDTVRLQPNQLTNAATITAIGTKMGMPPRAITVALATAFQESKMRNITHGDRDSVGLFQQRPSQGWGTVEQLNDPRYAATKFFEALGKINDWESLRITEAAQRVQYSGHPEAYDKWEADSRILAASLLGHSPRAITCVLREEPKNGSATALNDEHLADTGVALTQDDDKTLRAAVAADDELGWRTAYWLIAKSEEFGVKSVSYGGAHWTAESGKWKSSSAKNDEVIAELAG